MQGETETVSPKRSRSERLGTAPTPFTQALSSKKSSLGKKKLFGGEKKAAKEPYLQKSVHLLLNSVYKPPLDDQARVGKQKHKHTH